MKNLKKSIINLLIIFSIFFKTIPVYPADNSSTQNKKQENKQIQKEEHCQPSYTNIQPKQINYLGIAIVFALLAIPSLPILKVIGSDLLKDGKEKLWQLKSYIKKDIIQSQILKK